MAQDQSFASEKNTHINFVVDEKNSGEAGIKADERQGVTRVPWWKFGGKDYSFVSVDAGYPVSSSASSSDTDLPVSAEVSNVWQTDVRFITLFQTFSRNLDLLTFM